jgi:hypothetical protein
MAKLLSCYFDSKTNIFSFLENVLFTLIIVLFQVYYASCSGVKVVKNQLVFFSNFVHPGYDSSGILDRGFNSGTLPANPRLLARVAVTIKQMAIFCDAMFMTAASVETGSHLPKHCDFPTGSKHFSELEVSAI